MNENLPDKPPHKPSDHPGWFANLISAPGDYIKYNVLPKLRGPEYPYYHRVYKRVPTVDECKADDYLCIFEANEQYKRYDPWVNERSVGKPEAVYTLLMGN